MIMELVSQIWRWRLISAGRRDRLGSQSCLAGEVVEGGFVGAGGCPQPGGGWRAWVGELGLLDLAIAHGRDVIAAWQPVPLTAPDAG